MFRALLLGTVLASFSVVQADTLNISFGQPNYANMVRDAKLRGDGEISAGVPWDVGNIGNGSGGSNRFYANFLLNGTPSGRENNFVQWFDVSGIPAGSTINSATLSTVIGNSRANDRTWVDVNLSRLQSGKNWVEGGGQAPATDGSVTWQYRAAQTILWDAPGATAGTDIDLSTTQTFDIVGTEGTATVVVRDITLWVQGWVNTPGSNAGMLWWGGKNDETNSDNRYFEFGVKEDGNGLGGENGRAPSLVIDYTPPGAPVAPIIAEVAPDPDHNAFADIGYVKQLTLTQGSQPVTWTLNAGNPPGTTVNSVGAVSGWTPTPANVGGTFNFSVRATNAHGFDDETWQVVVHAVAPIIAEVAPDPENIGVNAAYQKQLTLDAGTAPITWTLLNGPAGASVDINGLVSGWTPGPDEAGNVVDFLVQASNVEGSDTEAWQVLVLTSNNGFFPDYLYVIHDSGDIVIFGEADGAEKGDLVTGIDAGSLTFSGEGRNDDARLFVARPNGTDTDVELLEVDSSGAVVKSTTLGAIIGGPVGPAIILGNIRYSGFHGTLFVGLNPNWTATTADVCYEIDLGLTTRIHTYTGPASFGQADPELEQGRNANIAINERDGTLYMVGRHLGEATGSGKGDLVAFTTAGRIVGGATAVFTTLIDGPTYSAGDAGYNQPHSVIYRQSSAGAADDTVLILMNPSAGAAPDLEFWLDGVAHPSGNPAYLALRGSPISAPRGWNGQQDEPTGDVWFAALRGGVHGVLANNTAITYGGGVNWVDVDSPPLQPCNEPFADIDGDTDVDLDDFGIFQRCFSGSNQALASCGCFDRLKDGDVDNFDFNAFSDCATGANIPWDQGLTPNCVP